MKEEFEKRRVNAHAIDDLLPRKKKEKRINSQRQTRGGKKQRIDKSNRPNAYPKMAKTLSTEANEEGP